MTRTVTRLLELAAAEAELPRFRARALALIGATVPFEAAFFHEFSPRAPLSSAARVGLSEEALARSSAGWDENAVLFGRIRDLALAQGGAARDVEAFGPRSPTRRAWNERVARPFGLRSVLLGHLVVHGRIVSVILLGRRRRAAFTDAERRSLARLLPALAVSDALVQRSTPSRLRGPKVALECTDQRLTPRQRELTVHVALGHTNAEIGRALGISPNTVRNLLAEARARVGAQNRAELVRLAVLSS